MQFLPQKAVWGEGNEKKLFHEVDISKLIFLIVEKMHLNLNANCGL